MHMWDEKDSKTLMIVVNTHEAHKLIQSLANQLVSGNPNSGRWEALLDDQTRYVSIAIMDQKEKP